MDNAPTPTPTPTPASSGPPALAEGAAPQWHPGDEIVLHGTPAAYNYTYGPVLVYEGPRSIDAIYKQGEPVVVVADMIPIAELRKIELTRVRGWIFEQGTVLDDELYNFLVTEKRAAVIGCETALYFAERGAGWAIVDGVNGLVCFNPSARTLRNFQEVRVDGPPERDPMEAAVDALHLVVEAKAAEKRKLAEQGIEIADPQKLSPKEIAKLGEQQPGLVMSILSGLPLPEQPKQLPGAKKKR